MKEKNFIHSDSFRNEMNENSVFIIIIMAGYTWEKIVNITNQKQQQQ